MKKTSKSRLLFLAKYIKDNTDIDNPLSTAELMAICEKHGYKCKRDTLHDDLSEIVNADYDIYRLDCARNINSYYYDGHNFAPSEVQVLIDAVASSHFISPANTKNLIDQLSELCGTKMQERFHEHIYISRRIKANNANVYMIIEEVIKAISENRKIGFQYYDYLPDKTLTFRNDGEKYIISPYAFVWDNDRYYLLGYSDKRQKVVSFRVDLMCMPELLYEERVKQPESFDPVDYANKAIGMYGGDLKKVTLEADSHLTKKLIDNFGMDINICQVSDAKVRAQVEVATSPTFYGKVFTYNGDVQIIEPDQVRAEYEAMLERLLDQVKGS